MERVNVLPHVIPWQCVEHCTPSFLQRKRIRCQGTFRGAWRGAGASACFGLSRCVVRLTRATRQPRAPNQETSLVARISSYQAKVIGLRDTLHASPMTISPPHTAMDQLDLKSSMSYPRFRPASASSCTIGTTRPVKRRNRTSSSTSRCFIIGYVITPHSATIPRPSSRRGQLWLNQVSTELWNGRYKASHLRKATAANNIVTRET